MWVGGVLVANVAPIGSKRPTHYRTHGSEGYVWEEAVLTLGEIIWVRCLHTPVGCLEKYSILE